jgi:hypothetical protein
MRPTSLRSARLPFATIELLRWMSVVSVTGLTCSKGRMIISSVGGKHLLPTSQQRIIHVAAVQARIRTSRLHAMSIRSRWLPLERTHLHNFQRTAPSLQCLICRSPDTSMQSGKATNGFRCCMRIAISTKTRSIRIHTRNGDKPLDMGCLFCAEHSRRHLMRFT